MTNYQIPHQLNENNLDKDLYLLFEEDINPHFHWPDVPENILFLEKQELSVKDWPISFRQSVPEPFTMNQYRRLKLNEYLETEKISTVLEVKLQHVRQMLEKDEKDTIKIEIPKDIKKKTSLHKVIHKVIHKVKKSLF